MSLGKLVCFDLDGTVMLRPDSLEFPLQLNKTPQAVLDDINRRELEGAIDWIAADYERAPYLAGLPVASIDEHLDSHLETVANLRRVLETLNHRGTATALVTSGPLETAQAVVKRFGFDYYFGSEYEISRSTPATFTGRLTRHLGASGKLDCISHLCTYLKLDLSECIAVGDGESDLLLFQAVGTSIAMNALPDVAEAAHHVVDGYDLAQILPLLH